METILKTQNLSVGIQNQVFLKNLNIEIPKGEILWIIGKNGSGKTSFLKTVLKFIPIIEGEIFVNGNSVNEIDFESLSKLAAFVPQKYIGSFEITVMDFLLTSRLSLENKIWGVSKKTKEKIDGYLEWYGLQKFKNRKFSELSGGERQKILILGALVQETELILLDEPLNSLDPHHQFEICEIAIHLAKNEKKGLVIVTHDLTFPLKIGGKVLVFEGNEKFSFGEVNEILSEEFLTKVYGVKFNFLESQGNKIPVF
ncbi:MAG: ABC transporter ATP-binding protein [Calditrichaeota bacterium]|nr:MAG: ABC transporter ATP-binding protein [Calditrichota bacterium]